jgi:hypothetical protein
VPFFEASRRNESCEILPYTQREWVVPLDYEDRRDSWSFRVEVYALPSPAMRAVGGNERNFGLLQGKASARAHHGLFRRGFLSGRGPPAGAVARTYPPQRFRQNSPTRIQPYMGALEEFPHVCN